MTTVDLRGFTTTELQNDLADSKADIKVCETALSCGITHHSDGMSVEYRLETNREIVALIEAELSRRGESS